MYTELEYLEPFTHSNTYSNYEIKNFDQNYDYNNFNSDINSNFDKNSNLYRNSSYTDLSQLSFTPYEHTSINYHTQNNFLNEEINDNKNYDIGENNLIISTTTTFLPPKEEKSIYNSFKTETPSVSQQDNESNYQNGVNSDSIDINNLYNDQNNNYNFNNKTTEIKKPIYIGEEQPNDQKLSELILNHTEELPNYNKNNNKNQIENNEIYYSDNQIYTELIKPTPTISSYSYETRYTSSNSLNYLKKPTSLKIVNDKNDIQNYSNTDNYSYNKNYDNNNGYNNNSNYNNNDASYNINLYNNNYDYSYSNSENDINNNAPTNKITDTNSINNYYSNSYNNNYNIYNNDNSSNKEINNDFNSNYNNYNNYDTSNNDPPENFNPEEFDLLELIGEGGFSKIYSVAWKKNGKQYALKKLFSKEMKDITNERNQVKILINFMRHTNCDGVIRIYGECIREQNATQYILMELADYDWEIELNERKKNNDFYTEEEIFEILYELTSACALLEKNNIAHRDIKPKNVLVEKGKFKLCDFSDSVLTHEGKTKQLVRGTELFMSPLLLKAFKSNNYAYHDCFKSDVYSLGMCMLLAATLNMESIEILRNINGKQNITNFIYGAVGNRYTYKFIDILSTTLETQEENRPNFIELESLVMSKINDY